MAKKTWKIGEYCKGGIITVETNKNAVTLICKDWDYSTGSNRGSDQSKAKEWARQVIPLNNTNAYHDIKNALQEWTTYYYASNIVEWIETKINLNCEFGWLRI